MKKKILLMLMLLFPLISYADTCDIVVDNQTTNERNLVCDATNRTSTLFKYTSSENVSTRVSDSRVNNSIEKYDFGYTGSVQKFTAPEDGYYQLEVWGASSKNEWSNDSGYGGYSVGEIFLNKNDDIYIYVGGEGTQTKGGYNGGGKPTYSTNFNDRPWASGGGGATHIAITKRGELKNYVYYKDEVLIVAGGGGGGNISGGGGQSSGGSAGGFKGNNGEGIQSSGIGGSQSSGGSGWYFGYNNYGYGTFGLGGSGQVLNQQITWFSGGGGGGWYGGSSGKTYFGNDSKYAGSGGGGSGYIGNNLLKEKSMYCYKCAESYEISTKTISTNKVSTSAISMYAKKGNGYARISYVENSNSEDNNSEDNIVDNSVCKITCSEEVLFSVDPIKKVLAGTSFSYPLYASGERKCTAVYNYNYYETKIKSLVNEYSTLTGIAKINKGNEITNFYAEKKACDEFVEKDGVYENKYSFNGNVELNLETSEKVITIPYRFVEMDEYDSNVMKDDTPYNNACNYNETTKKCDGAEETTAGWTEIVRIFGKYTMSDTYLEKYTGEIKNTASDDTCNVGDRYFVNLEEYTRPVENDTSDKGYSLNLKATNLGNNLSNTGDKWNLNVQCWYQVKNLIFPQNKPGGMVDDNYDELSGTGFMYRIIDVNNPFPNNREPGANWKGKESIISSTKNILSTLQRFEINLTRSSIRNIRTYNDTHSYESFNIDLREIFDENGDRTGKFEEYSPFVESFNDVIDRK